jgi:hypothetical protein
MAPTTAAGAGREQEENRLQSELSLHSFGHVPRLLFLLISSSITPLMLL